LPAAVAVLHAFMLSRLYLCCCDYIVLMLFAESIQCGEQYL